MAISESSPYDLNKLFLDRLIEIGEEEPGNTCCYFLDHHGEVEKKITIESWLMRSKKAALLLKEKGVQEGDRVILALPISEEFLILFVGLWWLGAIPVPLMNPMPGIRKEAFRERFVHMLIDCFPKGAVFLEERSELVLETKNGVDVEDLPNVEVWSSEGLMKQSQEKDPADLSSPVKLSDKSIAFLQYTSGSTGNPKGVAVTHGCLVANLQAIAEGSHMQVETDSCLSWMPFYHDMGLIGGLLVNTYYKVPLYLMSPISFLSRPSVWLESISKYKITLSTGNNFAYHLCAKRIKPEKIENFDLSSWRIACNGSESVNQETLSLFYDKFSPYGFKLSTFFPVYGMAEATLAISFPIPGSDPQLDHIDRLQLAENSVAIPVDKNDPKAVALVSNGYCLPRHHLKIRNPDSGQELKEREVGEICVRGPSITPGYFNKDNPIYDFEQELKTGDLGYLADNQLYVVDRIKDLIQIAGNNYYPSDIEKQVQEVEGIRPGRIIAFDVPNVDQGTNDMVVVSAISPGSDADEVKKKIRHQIYTAFGLIPKDIVFVDKNKIPVTSSGKIQRQKCKRLYLSDELKD